MNIDMSKIGKALLPVAALGLTFLAGIVNNKNQQVQMDKMISEKVAEALSNMNKES